MASRQWSHADGSPGVAAPVASRPTSDKRANRLLAIPADAGAVKAAEDRLKGTAQFDQLDETRQLPGRVHVGDPATAGDATDKADLVARLAVLLDVAVEMAGGA